MCKKYVFSFIIIILLLFTFGSGKADSQPEYYKNGDIGVFSAPINLPPGVVPDTSIFSADSDSNKIYLMYVNSLQSTPERVARGLRKKNMRYGWGTEAQLTAEQHKKIQKIDAELVKISKNKFRDKLDKQQEEFENLLELYASERKKEKKNKNTDLLKATMSRLIDLTSKIRDQLQRCSIEDPKRYQLHCQKSMIYKIASINNQYPNLPPDRKKNLIKIEKIFNEDQFHHIYSELDNDVQKQIKNLHKLCGFLEKEPKNNKNHLKKIKEAIATLKNKYSNLRSKPNVYANNLFEKRHFFIEEAQNLQAIKHLPKNERDKFIEINNQLWKIHEEFQKKRESLKNINREIAGLRLLGKNNSRLQQKTSAKKEKLELTKKSLSEKIKLLEAEKKILKTKKQEFLKKGVSANQKVFKKKVLTQLSVIGRFQGSGKAKVKIYARSTAELLSKPEEVAEIELNLPTEDGGKPLLLKKWAETQAKDYAIRILDSPYTSYYQYCLLQSKKKYNLSGELFDRFGRNRQWDRNIDLYSMSTGALAIQESLQLREMIGSGKTTVDRSVNISSLKGPQIKSHPFEKMLEGKTPVFFPVAKLVPYDNYYFHFSSITKEIELTDLLKQWGTSLLRSVTVSARDADLASRYSKQLCIDINELTRLFGNFIIGTVSFTGGDPFLREGSDIAVLIKVKQPEIFDSAMKIYADKMIRKHMDISVEESEFKNIKISALVTPDRQISSFSAYLDNYKVYTNRLELLHTIIDTSRQERKSMAENLDFQYMRTIFPGNSEAEDAFLYLSDAFIRKLLSPKWKIEGKRRIICQNHLRMIDNAATMYKTERQKNPSLKDLVENKFLDQKVLTCPDGGKYNLTTTKTGKKSPFRNSLNNSSGLTGKVTCSVHNCLQYCTPITDIAIQKVSKTEANEYKQFVNRYNNYWSRYFDPIGIRIKLGRKIEVETCILPLIENSIYNQLRQLSGGHPVKLDSRILTDRTIFSLAGKLNLDSEFFKDLTHWQQMLLPNLPEIKELIGSNISLNLYDGDVLFTINESGASMWAGRGNLVEGLSLGLIASAINLPTYLVLELQNEQATATFIREALKIAKRQNAAHGRRSGWNFGMDFEPYSIGNYNGNEINTITFKFFMFKFRVHYAIASQRLIVTTKRYVLTKVLDSLDKKYKDAIVSPNIVSNLALTVNPGAFQMLLPVTKIGWQERMRKACLKNLESVQILFEYYRANDNNFSEFSRKIDGVTMRCPCGGQYKYDPDRKIAYCTVHGNMDHPVQPIEQVDNEGLMEFLSKLRYILVTLKFTEEGIMTKLCLSVKENSQKK